LVIHAPDRSRHHKARLAQDKGHRAEWEAIVAHLTAGGPVPIPPEALFRSMEVTFAARRSLISGEPVSLAPAGASSHA
jgi:hypothetical protein